MEFMTLQTFIFGLMLTSALTGLVTEAVKKILVENKKSYQANTLTGIVAIIVSALVGVCYIVFTGVAFNAQIVIYILALIFLSWLCAMVGYDKVAQTITQIKQRKDETK